MERHWLSVLEAMSCGCVPIVSSFCFQDFIRSEIEGYFDANHRIQLWKLKRNCKPFFLAWESIKISTAAWTKAKEYSVSKVAEKYLRDFRFAVKRISV